MFLISAVRRQLVRVRDAIDARRHPGRLHDARARLAALEPESILFVCLGNICRSPYAAHVLDRRVRDGVDVASAGFILPGRPPPEAAVEAAAARGVATAEHRSRVVTEASLGAADAVFIFDRFNATRLRAAGSVPRERLFWLGDFDPTWAGKRAIIDPWGKPLVEFDRTFTRIDRCIVEVVEALPPVRPRGPATDETP